MHCAKFMRGGRWLGLGLCLAASLTVTSCKSVPKRGAAPPVSKTTPAAPVKKDPQSRLNDALQLMRDKNLQEAEEALLALNKDFPEFSGPLTNLGILYAKSNRRELALTVLTRATTLNGKNAVAWNWLGIVQRESGDRANAEQAYRKALAVRPDYALAHLNLAILYDTYLLRPQDALVEYKAYQKLAGKEELRVSAWIAEIESRQAAPPAAGSSILPRQVAPVAPGANPASTPPGSKP
jgi:tetratricopeptide (TPR) repeat protein